MYVSCHFISFGRLESGVPIASQQGLMYVFCLHFFVILSDVSRESLRFRRISVLHPAYFHTNWLINKLSGPIIPYKTLPY